MRDITEAEKCALWDEVRKEFPEDEMMQEIHYVRRIHHIQTKGLSPTERIAFYQAAGQAFH